MANKSKEGRKQAGHDAPVRSNIRPGLTPRRKEAKGTWERMVKVINQYLMSSQYIISSQISIDTQY